MRKSGAAFWQDRSGEDDPSILRQFVRFARIVCPLRNRSRSIIRSTYQQVRRDWIGFAVVLFAWRRSEGIYWTHKSGSAWRNMWKMVRHRRIERHRTGEGFTQSKWENWSAVRVRHRRMGCRIPLLSKRRIIAIGVDSFPSRHVQTGKYG